MAVSVAGFGVALKTHEGTSAAAARIRSRAGVASVDPLRSDPLRSFLATRSGSTSIAVRNLETGKEWLYNQAATYQTASIMKVDILETLLRQAELAGTPLSEDTVQDAQGMIENSDDADAQELWDAAGGSSGVGAYNAGAGLTQTQLNTQGYWGESTTSAADQIRVLDELVATHGLLDGESESYELGLMENVESDQDWGVSAGVPAGVCVALKNGWVPVTSDTDWEVNSIGRIEGDGRDYLIAVLTAHDPSETYGIDTIQGISPLVWSDLR
ncbi:MAG: serine hydrolase [Solirubrobacteraceae bacterium]